MYCLPQYSSLPALTSLTITFIVLNSLIQTFSHQLPLHWLLNFSSKASQHLTYLHLALATLRFLHCFASPNYSSIMQLEVL